jgi:hypothetical protein
MNRTIAAAALLSLASACQKAPEQAVQSNEQTAAAPAEVPPVTTANQAATSPAPVAAPEPGTRSALPDDRTPLVEPSGPIDPKSAEAAGQVVQHYGALIEEGRWTASWKVWSNPAAAKEFDRNWRNDSDVHMEVGKPAGMEGAAGSSYISVPVIFYGKSKIGQSFRRAAAVTLRRVNDVPGSTEAQRRWHIERIEGKASS